MHLKEVTDSTVTCLERAADVFKFFAHDVISWREEQVQRKLPCVGTVQKTGCKLENPIVDVYQRELDSPVCPGPG